MNLGLGIDVGGRTVHVRTDDLTPHEAGQVRESIKLIKLINTANETGFCNGMITSLAGILVTIVALIVCGSIFKWNDSDFVYTLFVGIFISILLGVLVGLFTNSSAQTRMADHAQSLRALMFESQRCDMFVKEYAEANDLIAAKLRANAPGTEPVTIT